MPSSHQRLKLYSPPMSFRQQQGVALIVVLLIFALASLIAIQMSSRLQIDVQRTENLLALDKGAVYARSAEAYAMALLPDLLKNNPQARTLTQQDLPPYPVEEGVLKVAIEDLSGRFNLNWLRLGESNDANSPYIAAFRRFLVALKVNDAEALDLAVATADWLDEDEETTGVAGAESQFYLSLTPPYRTGNQALKDVTELMLVRGMTPELFARIKPFICALPPESKLNLNTASSAVLLSLGEKVNQDQISRLESERKTQALEKKPSYLEIDTASVGKNMVFSSDYFLMRIEADILGRLTALNSVVYLPQDSAKYRVLSRKQTLF